MNNKENIDDDLNVKKEILWIKTNKIKLIRLKNSWIKKIEYIINVYEIFNFNW